MLRDIFKIIILTFVFSVVVFFMRTTFFTDDNVLIEDKYIEPVVEYIESVVELKEDKIRANRLIDSLKEKTKKELNSANKYYFVFIPIELKEQTHSYKNNIKNYIDNENLIKTISDLRVNFYAESKTRRGKMKNKTVKIFNPKKMGEGETQNIFIHEFAHYIDLYYFNSDVGKDLSNDFYNISWISTKTLRSGQNQKDFVSGYAMTNKYEDFAESLAYFVIDNKGFIDKAKSSENLKKKYEFLSHVLFKNSFLLDTRFTTNLIEKNYYRDITKLDLDLKKFLQYVKK